jgi:hypothetical protein
VGTVWARVARTGTVRGPPTLAARPATARAAPKGELRRAAAAGTLSVGRDRETIDSELRLLAAVRRSIREHGGKPSSGQVDELLDERLEISASSVR